MRILVVEDEPHLNAILASRLHADGYSVDSCMDGEEALAYIESAEYDSIILDIMIPRIDGLEVLQRMRKKGNATPVLLLTARDSVGDRVKGLDYGADDYLVKPFAYDELLARVRVLIRRGAVGHADNVLTFADLSIHLDTHTVQRGGEEIPLSAKEFALLEYIASNKAMALIF